MNGNSMLNPQGAYPRPPLVMIVTGQEWVSLSVETLFSPRGYAALHGDYTGAQAQQRLRETPVDLLVVDRDLRDMTGLALCRTVREKGLIAPTAPIMMIGAGSWPKDEKLEALRAGVWETVSLPTDSEELFVRVDTWVRAKLWADTARIQGLLDPDTGLYNAQGLLRRVTEVGASAQRHARPLGCVVMSAELVQDRTRTLPANGATETAVRTVAATLRAQGRASDTIGRLSGTEFVIVAPDTDTAGVRGLVDRIRLAMEGLAIQDTSPLRLRFGCYAVPNFGEASIAPTEMLVRAAEALRGAGPDTQVRFFAPIVDPD
jgi:diguanylate cyclase (GGDEF)-like protein